jgi:hypothetical protein
MLLAAGCATTGRGSGDALPSGTASAQTESSSAAGTAGLETWRAVEQTPEILAFFHNLFERIGIVVTDTGERFTVNHLGDRLEFEPGIAGRVDYTVAIQSEQIDRLAAFARSGRIPEEEQYRVMKVVFTPATAALLARPLFSSCFVRSFSGAEEVIHVTLRSPIPSEGDVSHTLLFVRGSWIVVPGLWGRPERVYHLTLQDAIVFQKRSVEAVKTGRWMPYAQWYRQWRKGVSETP